MHLEDDANDVRSFGDQVDEATDSDEAADGDEEEDLRRRQPKGYTLVRIVVDGTESVVRAAD